MSWTLRDGVSLHPMPFGGAFVLDDARLAARQISSELAALLAGPATASARPGGPGPGPEPVGPGDADTGPVRSDGTRAAPAQPDRTDRASAQQGGSGPGPVGPDDPDTGPAGWGGAGIGVSDARTGAGGVSPALAAELRLGVEEGWLIHREETG
ncbi:hypothetical protein NE235_18245 [Actinoallomurus spadix]|uniref:Uncharacterized protein n=1 Tax=Actinoallomurus spadix TaxID=79912 RepID=A0ABN0VYS5_9ACTN|nr:hypothetical protein [Actinoallomurus spadix]MCO5988046.1 hypothetical protein [Actinoallomurus spadix]